MKNKLIKNKAKLKIRLAKLEMTKWQNDSQKINFWTHSSASSCVAVLRNKKTQG